MKTKTITTTLFLYVFILTSFAQEEIKISDKLKLIKLSDHVYMHTCNNDNGIVYVNNGEALIVSTPDSEAETQNLVKWTRSELDSEIKAYIIDRWHPDAMGGLNTLLYSKIKTYAYEMTRRTAQEKGLPVPENGFDPMMELEIGGEKIICHYLGAAHTDDGIVVWIPSEKILFGGNEVRSMNGWWGNIGDANLKEWSNTITKVKEKYDSAKIVVPGHGKYGGPQLLDYTIEMYKPGKWGKILKANNMDVSPVFNNYGDIFETAKSYSVTDGKRHLNEAVVFVINGNRYAKIQSPKIIYEDKAKKLSSESGRLQIIDRESNQIMEDLYYNQLYLDLRNDAVGWTIILKEGLQ